MCVLTTLLAIALATIPVGNAGERMTFATLKSGQVPSEKVSQLYQDSEGYVWIVSSDGLARYDGYETKTWPVGGDGENHFGRMLHRVIEDNDGKLIVGTDRGLLTFDKATEQLTDTDDYATDDLNVNNFAKDADGRIWVCGDRGLFFRGQDGGAFTLFDFRTGFRESGLRDLIDILFDRDGNLWITSWHNGLYRYSPATGQLVAYRDGALNDSYVLHMDAEGSLWIGTWGAGLLQIPAGELFEESPRYRQYRHDPSDATTLLDDIIYDIGEDACGNILVGSRSGLSLMRGQEFENYYPANAPGSLPYNEVNSILLTKDKALLFGMFGGGACKAVQTAAPFKMMPLETVREAFKTNSVTSIYRVSDTKAFLGIAGHGFISYNRQEDSFENHLNIPSMKGLMYTSLVEDIVSRGDSGDICFGSYNNGLLVHNPWNGTTKAFNSTNSPLLNDCIRALEQDGEGNVLIATKRGAFVLTADDLITDIWSWSGISKQYGDNSIADIDTDNDGCIWMTSDYNGIIRIDRRRRQASCYPVDSAPESKRYSSLLADSQGNVWVGTTWNGLYMYDKDRDRFIKMNELVFVRNAGIRNIQESGDGRIWVTTADQVVSFSCNGEEIEDLWFQSISGPGTSMYFNNNAATYLPESDEMAFGCSHGVLLFPCRANPTDSTIANIVVTEVTANGKSITGGGSIPLITLAHRQNDIDVKFSLMDFNDSRGNIYRYRLSRKGGNAGEWMIVNGDNNTASFQNLSPGRYTFEVCGSRSNGYLTSNYKTLDILIKHNPATSWWAWLLYLTALGGLTASVMQSVATRMRYKRRVEYEQLNAQKAEEVNQAKLRFFTNVSHEFLTPLSIILAAIESLQPRSESDKHIADIMSVNAIRLTRLVQQVLEFRKAESDNLRLKVSHNDVASFVGHCVEAFQPLIRKRQLTISYRAEPQSIDGWFDPDKLDKIMYNLISNAVKYTVEGGEVRVSAEQPSAGTLVIKCANDGRLMDKKTLKKLFRRFYEGDYRKFNTIGTGIGLSLVKALVDKHKGHIEVSSDDVTGNCFTVTLPISEESYSPDEKDTDAVSDIPLAFSMGESIIKDNHTVLFVDDDEDLLSTFEAIMSKRYNILTCNSAEAALRILESQPVDIVVTDIMMPQTDGLDLCATIKGQMQTSHIPVILLSARKDDSSSIDGYQHGADGYLTKPCNFSVLSAMIGNLLKRQAVKSADFRKQLVFEVKDIDYTSTDKKFLQQAIDVVNEHIGDAEFTQTDFVNAMNVSRTILTEKLKSLTGFTPIAFIMNARLTLAYKMLMEQEDKIRVSDLAYSVGFNDAKYFSKRFRAKYGKSPKELIHDKTDNMT